MSAGTKSVQERTFLFVVFSSEWFQLLIIIALLLLVVLWPLTLCFLPNSKEELASWPSLLEVEELVKVETYDPHKPWPSLPHVVNKKYLNNLVQGIQCSDCVKIVVGPKDSGKTIGITLLVDAWRKRGHTVVDISLKGMSDKATWKGTMIKAAKGIYEVMSSLDYSKYWCVLTTVRRNCSHIVSRISQNAVTHVVEGVASPASIIALLGTVLPALVRLAQTMVPKKYLAYMPQKSLFYLSVVFAAIFSIIVGLNFRVLMYNMITPGIVDGNWNSLQCSLNAVCECEPRVKPVIIIREIGNFEQHAFQECLASLETMKEGLVQYPVILETSDFSWLNSSSVYKSRQSFCPYYLEEMSQSEMMTELVVRRQLWSEKEFELIYEALGGHMGSYSRLYMYQTHYNLSIADGVLKMKREAIAHITTCLNVAGNYSEAIGFLSKLKTANFKLHTVLVSDVMKTFLNCNLLFYNPNEMMIYSQMQLFQSAITIVLKENK